MLDLNSKIGRLLHDDHLVTLTSLQSVESLLLRQGNRPPALSDSHVRETLCTLVDVSKKEVRRHFAFEEEELFPLLEAFGQGGMISLLTMEHRAILPAAERAGQIAMDALALGAFSEEHWTVFREAASELVERELFHIQKEEMGLLAAIAALIPPEEDERLAHAFRAIT